MTAQGQDICQPDRIWWTADEIAASGLPDLPTTRRGVNALAESRAWRTTPALARRRPGRGGGWEYSWELFPPRAQRKLLAAAQAPRVTPPTGRGELWERFERLPADVRGRAQARLLLIQQVEALEPSLGRAVAVAEVARLSGTGARTIWSWLALVDGVRADDRLPCLAPRHRQSVRKSQSKDCDPEFLAFLRSDYLRPEAPPFSDCYRRACLVARDKGWTVLPERTMRRRIEKTVSETTRVLARKGADALKRMYPAQIRDKSALSALEAVNADFHRFDVFVRWPAEAGQKPTIARPQMVAFQDIHSGRILSWRVDVTPNATAVQLAAGDMIERWGIPEHVIMDNGREFAAKAITGGVSTRFRFKVREDDIPGLFVALGCQIHWATPYSGQSKPIERAFRDMCQSIAKDPRFAGAYTGNRPDAKPENYGSRAVDLADFLRVVGQGIEEHNTRTGRRSEVAFGRSFAEVFDESYASAPIRKATEAQRRLWLLGAEGVRADSVNGRILFQKNEFWAPWLTEFAGQRLVIRFDPADFWAGLHVYDSDGAYLGLAPCSRKAGFLDAEEARIHSRARAAWLAAERKAADAARTYNATALGLALDAAVDPPRAQPEAKVVRAAFGRRTKTTTAPVAQPDATETARVTALPPRPVPASWGEEGNSRARFRRALELERAIDAGTPIAPDQRRWLAAYQTTAEYQGERLLWDDMGDAIFG